MAVCTFWGQHHVKWRLEKLRFPKLNPQTHKTISQAESTNTQNNCQQGTTCTCIYIDCAQSSRSRIRVSSGGLSFNVCSWPDGNRQSKDFTRTTNYQLQPGCCEADSSISCWWVLLSKYTAPSGSLVCCKSLPEKNDNSMTVASEESTFGTEYSDSQTLSASLESQNQAKGLKLMDK